MFDRFRTLFENHGRLIQAGLTAFVLFGGVGMLMTLGLPVLGVDGVNTAERLLASAEGAYAFPITVLAFAILAFLGVPQVVLIGAAMVAFGPWVGGLYSWAGTLVSALIGFFLGRKFGAKLLRDIAGERVKRLLDVIGQNGFMASVMVRQAPLAPFVVVNMAAGITPMRSREFTAGTAIGIIPKILLIALGGHALAETAKEAFRKPLNQALADPKVLVALVMLALGIGFWIWAGWMARSWFKRRESHAP